MGGVPTPAPNPARVSLSEALDTAQPRGWERGEQGDVVGKGDCEEEVRSPRCRVVMWVGLKMGDVGHSDGPSYF